MEEVLGFVDLNRLSPLNLRHYCFVTGRRMKCSPSLGQPELEFSRVKAHVGICADEPFMSEIGTLLPMALCVQGHLLVIRPNIQIK